MFICGSFRLCCIIHDFVFLIDSFTGVTLDNQSSSTVRVKQPDLFFKSVISTEKFNLIMIMALVFVSFLIVIGPKWKSDFIHISIVPGRGLTDQDAVALIPIGIASILFFRVLWKFLPDIQQYIHHVPQTAFIAALVLGLSIGFLLGTGFGIVFKYPLVDILKSIIRPLREFIYG